MIKDVFKGLNMIPVAGSSLINGVKWKDNNLAVYLSTGRTYVYYDVAATTVLNFLSADSHGRFFNQSIRDSYNYSEIE